jgi:hypothetical protein
MAARIRELPVAHAPAPDDEPAPGRGWRLAGRLALLGLVVLGILWLLPDPPPNADPAVGMHPAIIAPWSACARAAVAQFGRDVQVIGPKRITWDRAGRIVDVLGTIARDRQPDRPFGCRAIRIESHWEVERLVFAP